MHSLILSFGMLVMLHTPPSGGNTRFPFSESFDSLTPPDLPPGWISSQDRSPGTNDFTTTASTPLSVPNALISTNATVAQFIVTPEVDFRDTVPDSIIFFTRRSSTHLADVVLEASLDGGATFPIAVGDTLINKNDDYVRAASFLPDTLATVMSVRFRWRVIADVSGTTGTFRIDDIAIVVSVSDDLALVRTSIMPPIPGPSDPLTVTALVANAGLRPASDFTVTLFLDRNADSLATSGEQAGSTSINDPMEPGDSVGVDFTVPPLNTGMHHIIATVSAAVDGNPSNDTLLTTLAIRHAEQSLVINEIMFDPATGVGEYLELLNPGIGDIDLGGWLIRDRAGSGGTANTFAFSGSAVCPPGGFVVLAEDSTVLERFPDLLHTPGVTIELTGGSPSLNNDGDDVILLDPAGGIVDSVSYLPSWHHPEVIDSKGRSLEKVHPFLNGADGRNWSTSANREGGTPGGQNSLYTKAPTRAASLTFSPNPFSPDGDGRDDVTVISFATPSGSSTFSLRIYDIEGRLIRQLSTNELTGPTGQIVWDGFDDQRRKARIGMYVVYLEILGGGGEVFEAKKGVVVLAGQM